MLQVEIKVDDKISKEINKVKKQLKNVPVESLKEFKSLTPIDSGNARRKTRLEKDTIKADYPYAQRLDEGWSKQAPRGMTIPFEKWFKSKIKQIMGR